MGFFNWLFGYKKKKEDERKVPYSTLTRQQIYGSYKSRNHEYANSGTSVPPSNQGDDLLNPLNPLNPLSPFWIGNSNNDNYEAPANSYQNDNSPSHDYSTPIDTTPEPDHSSSSYDSGSSSSYDSGSSSSYDSGSSSSYDSGSSSSGSDF